MRVLSLEVVYSPRAREVVVVALQVPPGTTVQQALEASGVLRHDPQHPLDLHALTVSVWGRKTALTHAVGGLDRLELTRALRVDPKVARRARFQKQGVGRAGLFAKRRAGAKPGY